jgi:tRNA (guanine37-N1)-methyltransferase
MRIARQIQPYEVIVNMFAGVGCYSIVIAKHSKAEKIFSIDINPAAFRYMRENIYLNKVSQRMVPLHGDASAVIQERLQNVADRVLLPLPSKAYEYLYHAKLALKSNGGRIHYYDFEHAERGENPIAEVKARVSKKLRSLGAAFEAPFGRVVRTIGPRWYQVVVDITILP